MIGARGEESIDAIMGERGDDVGAARREHVMGVLMRRLIGCTVALLVGVGGVGAASMTAGADRLAGQVIQESPADPDAAKQAIIETWEAAAALTDGENVAANLHLVDDPRGVVEAARQAYENFPYEVTHDTNRVTDVRFTSPTDAEVTWDILIEGGLTFTGRTGAAVFRDGRWKLTRATACESLALAGGNCDEPVPPVGNRPIVVLEATRTLTLGAPSAPPAKPVQGRPAFTG